MTSVIIGDTNSRMIQKAGIHLYCGVVYCYQSFCPKSGNKRLGRNPSFMDPTVGATLGVRTLWGGEVSHFRY